METMETIILKNLIQNEDYTRRVVPFLDEEYGFTNQTIEPYNDVRLVPEYALNHIDINGQFTNFSNLGNRCKVEIISRTDLLRARGFKG